MRLRRWRALDEALGGRMTNLAAATLIGGRESEVEAVEPHRLGVTITAGGCVLLFAVRPDAEGKTGLMLLEPPAFPRRLPVYAR